MFGGQVMLHGKVRIDERATPMAIDSLNLDDPHAGTVTNGIMEWVGENVRFLMSGPGRPRPADCSAPPGSGTLSKRRRRS